MTRAHSEQVQLIKFITIAGGERIPEAAVAHLLAIESHRFALCQPGQQVAVDFQDRGRTVEKALTLQSGHPSLIVAQKGGKAFIGIGDEPSQKGPHGLIAISLRYEFAQHERLESRHRPFAFDFRQLARDGFELARDQLFLFAGGSQQPSRQCHAMHVDDILQQADDRQRHGATAGNAGAGEIE